MQMQMERGEVLLLTPDKERESSSNFSRFSGWKANVSLLDTALDRGRFHCHLKEDPDSTSDKYTEPASHPAAKHRPMSASPEIQSDPAKKRVADLL